jgi:Peptidase family S41/PDZ domain
MKKLAILVLLAPLCLADLTQEQKVADFLQLANLYAKYYAPYQWKRDVIGFDLYDGKPWLDQVKATKTDPEFWDICVKYVAALQDSHDEFTLPSNYYADLHFTVDIYDGKVLIDGIDRVYLPKATYGFNVGDELVSVDGKPVADLITSFIPYAANGSGSTSSRRRLGADAITFRQQFFMPRAYEVPDSSVVAVLGADGKSATYTIKWDQQGTALTTAGILPSIRTTKAPVEQGRLQPNKIRVDSVETNAWQRHGGDSDEPSRAATWGTWQGAGPDVEAENVPDYMQTLYDLQQMSVLKPDSAFAGFGLITPAFNPPAGFKLRLGAGRNDLFLSGTFPVGTKTVGFLRIPTMSPASVATALQQYTAEILYFNANTDALVVDVTSNGGGSLCYIEQLMSLLTSGSYTASNYQIRAADFWVAAFDGSRLNAIAAHADQWVINLYGAYINDVQAALKGNRAMTGVIPICGPNASLTGLPVAYSKPILTLTDDFTLSAGEAFSMMMQDSGRGKIFGARTDGGGGNPGSYTATTFSEGMTRVTRTFVIRGKTVQTPGFPASNYLENTGVYPDIQAEIMTRDNLMTGGQPYVKQLTQALTDLLK